MSNVVVLSEKPSQATDYASVFSHSSNKGGYIEAQDNELFDGKKTLITWTFGHLIQLAQPESYHSEWKYWDLKKLPIIPENYKFEVGSNSGIKRQFGIIKKIMNDPDTSIIVVASDPAREGENIARSTMNKALTIENKKRIIIKRLWINSLEKEEIKKGFQNLKDGKDFENLFIEAQTRQISDWLLGINGTRLYTLLLRNKGQQGTFSVGRVISPSLYLIYQRQEEINNFVPIPFYQINGKVTTEKGVFEAKYKDRFEDKSKLNDLLNKHNVQFGKNNAVISKVEKTFKKTEAPKLHSLSTLQTKINKKYKISPSSVLDVVQKLYDRKLLSYPRTDTQYITEGEFNYLKENLASYKKFLNSDFKEVYLEPRKRFVDGSLVTEHYALIPTRQIAKIDDLSEQELNIYKEIMITTLSMFTDDYHYEETKVEVDINGLNLNAKGNVEKTKGWKALTTNESQSKEKTPNLPELIENEKCSVQVNQKEDKTKAPSPYTEGGLIGMMVNAGKELDDKDDKATLKRVEGIGTEATRSNIIESLKRQEYIEVKKNVVSVSNKGVILCKAIGDSLLASPEMTAKWETYLQKIGEGEGSQKEFLDSIKRFVLAMVEEAPDKVNSLEGAIKESVSASSLGACPSCKEGLIINKGVFYQCNRHTEGCKFTVSKKILKKSLSDSQVKTLITKGKTNLIKGFTSKKGKSFSAYLVLDGDKIKFEFAKK